MMKLSKFDIAEHLETDEDIREFIKEVASEGNESDLIHALNIAARAKGMTALAEKMVSAGPVYTNLCQKTATQIFQQSIKLSQHLAANWLLFEYGKSSIKSLQLNLLN